MKNNISFIVPAYNCQETLKESIESIFDGNAEVGDEIIIIDDASTDSTPEIISSLRKKYDAIVTVKHHINKGSAAAARNTGIDIAKNDLLFCLDSDNILVPGSIFQLKQMLISQNLDAAAFGEIHYFKDSIVNFSHKWVMKPEIKIEDNVNTPQQTPCSSGNYLYTKDIWKKANRHPESFGGAYDSWAFGMQILLVGGKFKTLEQTFYYHRIGYESTFVKEEKKNNPSIIALQVLLPYFDFIHPSDRKYILRNYSSWWRNIANKRIRINDRKPKKSFLDKFRVN